MVTLKVILSLDGKHRVEVSSDNPGETRTALEWARQVYDKLPPHPDPPEIGSDSVVDSNSDLAVKHEASRNWGDRNLSPEGHPTCPTHGELARSKYGGWYCPAKDGEEWCKFKIK